MHFVVSGVEVHPLLPPLVALCISFFTSMGGVSGAFLLMPFQVSVLGFDCPAVSPTNLIYNIVATPSGVYRFIREGRMAWPLTWVIVLGTVPGVFLGVLLRLHFLPDARGFKLFVGCVLAFIGLRMLSELVIKKAGGKEKLRALEERFKARVAKTRIEQQARITAGLSPEAVVETISMGARQVTFTFYGERFSYNPTVLFLLTLVVGVVGGTYGIGGGAIIAPILVSVYNLPIYAIAGSTLFGTFLTSIVGVAFYTLIAPLYADTGLAIAPDWALGGLFGAGGAAGIYLGARTQKYVPAKILRILLGALITFLAGRYVLQYFL